MFLNKYADMLWDLRKGLVKKNIMELRGGAADRDHVIDWAGKLFEEIEEEIVEDATREDIMKHLAVEATADLAMLLIYFQGHGISSLYVTADGHYPGSKTDLRGLGSRELVELLSNLNCNTWRIIVGDFCHTDNFIRLRYQLMIDEQGPRWVQTKEWNPDDDVCSKQSSAPTLYLAGCTEHQSAFETLQIGGYCTMALTSLGGQALTLPDLLGRIREYVRNALREAGKNPESQTPQFYSNVMLPLHDPDFLKKFQDHTLSF